MTQEDEGFNKTYFLIVEKWFWMISPSRFWRTTEILMTDIGDCGGLNDGRYGKNNEGGVQIFSIMLLI